MSSSSSEIQNNLSGKSFSADSDTNERIIYLKERLLINNINKPNFVNYYNSMEEGNIIKENKNQEIQMNVELKEYYDYIQKLEQIDDIKINLFFILKLKCDYNNQYKNILFKRYIKTKRLVIQKYTIEDKKITFGPKEYSFIPVNNKDGDIFKYKGKEIQFIAKGDKGKKDYIKIDNKEIMTEKIFQKKYNLDNLYEEEKEYKKALNKSNKSDKIDLNTDKKKDNPLEIKDEKISSNKIDNKALSQLTPELNSNYSRLSETSDKEIDGPKFFDENYRYIYKCYSKEIDGLYYTHPLINLYSNEKKDIIPSLNLLLNGAYDNKNDLQSNIILKNFDSDKIDGPFFLEVKKSLAELTKLLIQIKEISKIAQNIYPVQLPKYVIGIICSYNENQINTQIGNLNKEYKKNSDEKFLEHAMKIINNSGMNVLISVIKDESIMDYPLGIDDFRIGGANLTKRIDIYYINKKICNNEYLPKELEAVCEKYPYKSLSFDIADKSCFINNYTLLEKKYDSLQLNYQAILENYQKLKEENKKLKEKKNES